MILHYDRDGKPISFHAFAQLLVDEEYKRVAEAHVGPYWVSTVWLGIDHSFGYSEQPIIFETMVFGDAWAGEGCWRWCTEEEARRGHDEVVLLVRATTTEGDADEPVPDVRPDSRARRTD